MTNNWYAQNPYWHHPRNQHNQFSRYSRISIDDAMEIALEQIPGEVVKAELDTENGTLVYEVDIINMQGLKYEIVIDTQTGRIVKLERD